MNPQLEAFARLCRQITDIDPPTPSEREFYDEMDAADAHYEAEVVSMDDWCHAADQDRKEAREWGLCKHGQHQGHCDE